MRNFLLIAGTLLILYSVISTVTYVFDYGQLSTYGKGHVWGKLLLAVIGASLIYGGIKKTNSEARS